MQNGKWKIEKKKTKNGTWKMENHPFPTSTRGADVESFDVGGG